MDWKEVDLEEAIWTIPAERTKTKAEHDVMLPTQAVELLQSLEPKKKGRIFAFDGVRDANITTHVAEQIRLNRDHLGVPENFSSHSLRHTGQTLLARLNDTEKCPVEVRDRISNHKPGGEMSALYNANDYDEDARIWLQKMADRLDEIAGGSYAN
jgi:integrase